MGETSTTDYGLNLYRYLESVWDSLGETRGGWCRMTGMADSTVLRWMQGYAPSLENMMTVANALGVSLPQVLYISGYLNEKDIKVHAAPKPSRPTVSDAIELDNTITEQERVALRMLHEAFGAAADGKKRTVRVSSRS